MIRGAMSIDHLWVNISELPYFRGLLRAVEARFYEEVELPQPILDLGCGDGQFITTAFTEKIDVGLDPWTKPVLEAVVRGGYHSVVQGSGYDLPFPDATFASVMSNSVLEHIPDLDRTLSEVSRVLSTDGRFVFCVPNHQFLPTLSISTFLDKVGLRFLSNQYRRFFNFLSRHHHCDSPDVWQARLEKSGFQVVQWWHYFSPAAFHTLEWGHFFGLPSLIVHFFTRQWILLKTRWNLVLTIKIVGKHYHAEPKTSKGVYTFYIARKVQ